MICKLYARWLRLWNSTPLPHEIVRFMAWVFPAPHRCKVTINDLDLVLDPHDLLQANLIVDGDWEPHVTKWWTTLASRSQRIMDIGAHCGYFTALAGKSSHENAVIYSFEPNPTVRRLCEENIALNQFTNIHLIPMAANNQDNEVLTLYVRDKLETGISSRHPIFRADRTEVVQSTTLDTFLKQQNLDQVDLIKMDIEGGELAALQGMSEGLQSAKYGICMIEIHPRPLGTDGLNEIMNILVESGYQLYEITADRWIPVNKSLDDIGYLGAVSQRYINWFISEPDGSLR